MNAKTRATLPDWLWELLQRLDDELVLRGCVRQTRSPYSAHVRRFYAGRPRTDPVAKDGEVRSWMLDMLRSGLSHSYANQALSALRFLHRHVLNAPAPVADIPRPKREKRLPKILSEPEVRRFLDELGSPKHRAIAFILYSAGLRVGEAARLQVEDVDSQRGQIHVRRGKGGKDRYAILSSVVLAVLGEYAAWIDPCIGSSLAATDRTDTSPPEASKGRFRGPGREPAFRSGSHRKCCDTALRPTSWRVERT